MKDSESKFKDDFERASMDVQMLRERLDKTENNLAKTRSEGDKAVGDLDKVSYELEKTTNQFNKAHNNLEKSQEEVARLQVRYIFFCNLHWLVKLRMSHLVCLNQTTILIC